jgi:hypothetical protein
MKKKIVFALFITAWPLSSFALLTTTGRFFNSALDLIQNIIIPLVFALAMLFFFWGIAKYIRSTGTDKEEGKKIMTWGVIALFVMASVWGIVRTVQGELEIRDNGPIKIPGFTI